MNSWGVPLHMLCSTSTTLFVVMGFNVSVEHWTMWFNCTFLPLNMGSDTGHCITNPNNAPQNNQKVALFDAPPKWVVEWSMSKFYFHLQKLWMPSCWIYTWAKLMHDESASMPIGIFAASASGWEKNEQAAMCGTVLTLMKDHVMPTKGEMASRNHTSFLLKPMLAIWLKIGLAQYNPTWKLKTKN